MTVFDFKGEPTLIDLDGTTETEWFLIPEPGVSTMPYSTDFEKAGETWFIEYEVIRGRIDDLLMLHVFRSINGQTTPILDTKFSTGMQVEVDEKIRLYGFDIRPFLQDNYLRVKTGKYQVMVSEVV